MKVRRRKTKDGKLGSWTGVCTFDGRQKRLTAHTITELDRKVTALKDSVYRGTYIPQSRMLVTDALDLWLAHCKRGLEASTLQRYRSIADIYLRPSFEQRRIATLMPLDVDKAVAKWRSGGRKDSKTKTNGGDLTASSIRHIYNTLKTFINFCQKRKFIASNPCVDAPKGLRREIASLEPSGVAGFLEAIRGCEIESAIIVALGTGMRRGELLGLQLGDLDLEGGRVFVRRSLERIARVQRFKDTKTPQSRRTLALPPFVVLELRKQCLAQTQRLSRLGMGGSDRETPVFDRDGKPWNPATFSSIFYRLLKRAEIPQWTTFHGLRHSFATLSLSSGVDLKTISTALGHSAIGITANTYVHGVDQLSRDAANRLESIIVKGCGNEAKEGI